ncbi:FAD-binding domain-containing protein [Microthyrium microscopicum]|uniref:FAD-binding domain-containing protein n=1 Tax=Microthyrium microscopicum TaxID=703497 RepID=A0A6A6UA77_9PEZI|nr:FAD-binding domain-containing protein [Microthyrium microscopicum]
MYVNCAFVATIYILATRSQSLELEALSLETGWTSTSSPTAPSASSTSISTRPASSTILSPSSLAPATSATVSLSVPGSRPSLLSLAPRPPIAKSVSGPIRAQPKKLNVTISRPFRPEPTPPDVDPPLAASPSYPNEPLLRCKTTVGDNNWPTYDVWQAEIPGVMPLFVIGRDAHPNYFLAAQTPSDVQAAVKFAAKHNIRLSIISSGLDYLGRNNAPNGLLLSLKHLKGIRQLSEFEANQSGADSVYSNASSSSSAPQVPIAVSVGAGVTAQELNNSLEDKNVFMPGPASGAITIAGGWSQGGGHGPLSSTYGLGAHQVLEYQVITADGELRIANSVSNPDLFWALRGGSGSTFGVVVQATVKVYKSPEVTVSSWWINATTSSNATATYQAAAYLHSQFPALNAQQVQGYYNIYPKAIRGVFLLPSKGISEAKQIWDPVLQRLQGIPGMSAVIQEHEYYANYKEMFDGLFGMLNQTAYEPEDRCHKKWEWRPDLFECQYNITTKYAGRIRRRQQPLLKNVLDPQPAGRYNVDSQLMGVKHLSDFKLADALEKAMPRDGGKMVPDAMLQGYLIAGRNVMKQDDTSIHPAWKEAYVLITGTNVSSIRAISPDMGSYVEEGYWNATDWKNLFWGSNYNRLESIKNKYDPNHVFFAAPGIGSDFWTIDASKLCKDDSTSTTNSNISSNSTATIPRSDNANFINPRNSTAFATPWPKGQADADKFALSARIHISRLRETSLKIKAEPTPTGTFEPGSFTPISVSPRLPDWTPLTTGTIPWDSFIPVETDA